MLLTDYLTPEHIRTDFQASGKSEALEKLCRFLADLEGLDGRSVLKVVENREKLGSTGLGGGVALPHGKSPDVKKPVLVMAVSPEGVEFDSADGLPVRVFVLIVTPDRGDGREHLAILARLGGLFKSQSAVAAVLEAAGPAAVHDFLVRRDV